jgi:hypothetical protein
LPKHVVPYFFSVGTHGSQCSELVVEDFVRMGSFMRFERSPIGHDDIMVIGGSGFSEGSLVRDKPGEPEYLSGEESAFVTSVVSFDDTAKLTDGQFNVFERDSSLELDGIEQHLGSKGDCDWTEHVILLTGC